MNKIEKKTRRSGIVIMLRLVTLVKSLMLIMFLAILNGSLGFVASMGVTVSGGFAIASFLGYPTLLPWWGFVIISICCGVVRGALRYFEQYSNHFIAFKLLASLRDKIFANLRILCPAKLEGKDKGSIISLITADIETLEIFYAHTISPICIAFLISTTSFLFIGFLSSWYIALVSLFGYVVIGIILPLYLSKFMKESGVKYRNKFSSFNSYFLDSIKGIKDIILNNNAKERGREVNRRSDELLEDTKKIKKYTFLGIGLTEIVVSLIVCLALIVGILLVAFDNLDLPFVIVGIVTLMSSFGPVIALSALPSNLTQTFASGDRLLNLLEENPIIHDVTDKEEIENIQSLNISNLSFTYPNTDTLVLDNVNLEAKKGQIIGLVGRSGCGKSTLLKLLLHFYPVEDKTSINFKCQTLDNNIIEKTIEDINTKDLLKHLTLVSQNSYLFDNTIEYNLKIAKEDATEEEMIEACKKASIYEFIENLPNGFQTRISSLGSNVSAGEKQRLALARAFLRKSTFILLDEPTSNVDAINEGIILESLKNAKSEHCIILVSHRESTMAIADKVYKVEHGRLS